MPYTLTEVHKTVDDKGHNLYFINGAGKEAVFHISDGELVNEYEGDIEKAAAKCVEQLHKTI